MFIYNPLGHRSLQSPNRTGPPRGAERRQLLAGVPRSRDQQPPPPPRRKYARTTAAVPRPPLPLGGPALGPPLPRARAGPGASRRRAARAPPAQRRAARRARRACVCAALRRQQQQRESEAKAEQDRGREHGAGAAAAPREGCRSSERGLPQLSRPSAPGAVRRAGRHQRRDSEGHGPGGDSPLPR